MFVPIPTAAICELSSRSSRYIAQTVCRPWQNVDSTTWHSVPEIIDLRPDGTGTVSSSFKQYAGGEPEKGRVGHEFTWRLGRDGPLGMEGIDEDAMYITMPKLMQSTRAWTRKPWVADHGIVPAYIRINLSGGPVFSTDIRIDIMLGANASLPIELIELIMEIACAEDSRELLYVSKWTRELLLSRRRHQRFSQLVQSFALLGLAFWIDCGHFDPPGNPNLESYFAFRAVVHKMPWASGYSDEERRNAPNNWDDRWKSDPRVIYHSGVLKMPEEAESSIGRLLQGLYSNDEHPEVKKIYNSN